MYIFKDLNNEVEKTLFDLCTKMIKEKDEYTKAVYADIAKYIVPERSTLFNSEQKGQDFGKDIYDGWPGFCQRKMVNALYGSLCPQNTNWMEFQLLERPPNHIAKELNALNHQVLVNLAKTNFYGNQSQFIGDGSAFGNGVQYIKDDVLDEKVKFLTIHPAQYYLYTEEDGDVKAVLRKMKVRYIDIIKVIQSSTMGEEWRNCLPEEIKGHIDIEGKLSEVTAYHIIYDRKYFRDFIKLPEKYSNADYVGVWYLSQKGNAGQIVAIDRHEYFPYIVWRYQLESGWTYGFGPGHYALQDARVLQQIEKSNIESGQRAAAPPVQAPQEMKNKVKNRPYGITYYEDANRKVEPLYSQTNWTAATETAEKKREIISFHYMMDVWQTLSQITARMTAYEVAERIGEKLSMISAVIGNFLNEGLTPQIRLFFALEVSSGRIQLSDNLKKYIGKEGMRIEYTSLLAQSLKKQIENQGLMRTMSEMQVAFEMNPELRVAFNWYRFAERMIKGTTTSLDVLKEERTYNKEIEELKRQQQEMAAQKAGGENVKGMV